MLTRLIILVCAAFAYISNAASQNCFPNYIYRAPITISNGGGSLTNFQIKITMNTSALVSAGKMRSDGNDILFASAGCTNYSYYIESGMNTANTVIWVKVPSIAAGANTMYIYYGYSSAPLASSGTNTFDFFDDFTGSALSGSWTIFKAGSNTVTVGSGAVSFNSSISGGDAMIRTNSTFPTPCFSEMNVTALTNSYPSIGQVASSTFNGASFAIAGTTAYSGAATPNCTSHDVYFNSSATAGTTTGIWSLRYATATTATATWPGGTLNPTLSPSFAYPSTVHGTLGALCYSSTATMSVDWYRIRKYAATVPTTSFGSEVYNMEITWQGFESGSKVMCGDEIYRAKFFLFGSCSGGISMQFSDASGSFTTPAATQSLGSYSGGFNTVFNPFPVNYTLQNLPYGTGYKIRLIYTPTGFTGAPSAETYTFGAQPQSSNFTINDVDQCNEEDMFTFTATGSIATGNTRAWDWNFGDGNTGTGTPVSHGYTYEGGYNVNMKVYNSQLAKCSTNVSKSVTVYPQPISQPYADGNCVNANGNNGTYFYGYYSYDPWSYIAAYDWKLGDGNTNSYSDFYHKYATHGAYTVSLTVTNAYGCKDTSTFTHNVYPKPVVNFTNTLGCDGDPIQFKDVSTINSFGGSTLSNPNGSYSYYLFGDGSAAQYDKNPSYLYSAPGTYSVYHYVESNYGCGDTVRKNVIVNPAPVAKFTANNACLNDIVAIANNSTISSGSLSYKWNLGDGNFSTAQIPTPTYNTPGGYNIKLYAIAGTGCMDSAEKNITVYGLPTAQFGADEVCAGTATQFTNYSVDASSSFWTFEAGQNSNAENPSHVFSSDGTFTVILDVETANGCKASIKKDVVVNPNPVPAFNFSTPTNCLLGHMFTFANTTTISSGTFKSYWTFGDNTVSNDLNPIKAYANAGDYNVDLEITSDKGCIVKANSQALNVRPMPVAAFTFNNSCENTNVPFTNQSTVSSGSITGNAWTFGDGGTSTQTNPSRTYANDGNYNVGLTVTTNFGCQNSISKVYTAWPNPTVAFTSSDVCFGLANKFTNTSGVGSGFMAAYDWNFGDATTSAEINPSHVYATSGTFNVSLKGTTDKGCFATANGSASVWPQPKADFTVTNVCQGKASVFTNTSTISGGSINNNNWTFGDGGSSTVLSPTHTYSKYGNYTAGLTVVSDKNCSSTISKLAQVFRQPIAKIYASTLKTSVLSPEVSFSDNSVFGDFSDWNFGFNGRTSTNNTDTCTYTKPGKFNVRLVSSTVDACSDTANVTVDVVNGYTIFFPTAFTPNGDKLNDEFGAVGIFEGITTYELNILDSRGRVVFNTSNINAKWNGSLENLGEPVPPGNYAWFANYTDFNGKKHTENGVISIRK